MLASAVRWQAIGIGLSVISKGSTTASPCGSSIKTIRCLLKLVGQQDQPSIAFYLRHDFFERRQEISIDKSHVIFGMVDDIVDLRRGQTGC